MSSQPGADAPVRVALSEHLQAVTETLAAARTGSDVFSVVLTPALDALNAIAGAVLLVDETGTRLVIAATQGYEEGAQTLWQDGPLDGNVPAGDALECHEPLFFEAQGALTRAYPELEARTGGIAAVATAVLPMFLDDSPLGAIILDFKEPHHFTPEEQRFLCTLAAQCAVALGRVRSLDRLKQEARQKTDILESISDAFYAVDRGWRFTYVNREAERLWGRRREDLLGQVYWEAFPQAVGSAPYQAHLRAARERRVVRLESRSPILNVWVDITIYPTPDGLSVYFKDISARKQAEEEVRDLNRTLERRVEERTRDAEDARSRAEVLAALGDALQAARSPEDVAVLALTPLGEALGASSAMVVRLEDGLIPVPTVWGERLPAMAALQTRDVPLGEATLLTECARTGKAGYYADYTAARGGLGGLPTLAFAVEPIHAPGDGVAGFLCVWRPPRAEPWPEGDRDLLRRAAATLGLALERAATTQALGERTEALDAFVAFTERVDGETDVHALVARAADVLRAALSEVSVAYYELEDGLWKVQAWSSDVPPDFVARMREGFSPDTPRFAHAIRERQPYFVQTWRQDAERLPDTRQYHAMATYPFFRGETPHGVLAVGLTEGHRWTEREQAVVRAVGRSLGLALERAEVTRHLLSQRQSLEAANEELEAFTYSVSHDLRTPVRHVMSFNDLLRRHLGEGLDAKAARYLTVVGEAAARMNTLIDAMLDLSRTSRLPLQLGPVDLNELVRTVRTELEADVLDRRVAWEIGPLPVVTGDHGTLRQVVVNLLENALKYTRTREVARIEVGAEEHPGEWVIWVRDDGVGFDPQYGNKLFGVFQRLHPARDFEGTGVGLANVRRIIARHGGRVWAEGQPGEGATFRFSLPRD